MSNILLATLCLVGVLEVIIAVVARKVLIRLRDRRHATRGALQYFIRGLSLQQREKLKSASIPFGTTALDPDEGALFDRAHLKAVLEVLDAEVLSSYSLHGREICELVVHFHPGDRELGAVRIRGRMRFMSRWTMKRLVREIIGPHVQREIVVHLRAGIVSPPEDGQFHVFIGGAPKAAQRTYAHESRICNLPNTAAPGWAYTGVGHLVSDSKTNAPLAEIVGECLYLYLDLAPNAKRTPDFGLLARILQKAAAELSIDSFMEEISAYLATEGLGGKCTHPVSLDLGLGGRLGTIVKSVVEAALAPAVDREIIIAHGGGQPNEAFDDGAFGVFLYSAPEGCPSLPPVPELWGVRGLSRCQRFPPSPKGLLLSDDRGNLAGELLPNALYIHSDILTVGTAPELAVLTRILVQAVKSMPLVQSPDAIDAASLSALEKACLQLISPTPSSIPSADEVRSARRAYHETMRRLTGCERDFYAITAQSEDRYGKEFDALCTIEKVVNARLQGDALVINTSVLYCVNPATRIRHEIGAFEIYLYLSTGDVKWINQTRQVRGHQAPHVNESGNACLGNMAYVYSQLIRGGQLPSAAEAAIAFVESVNVNDAWGKYIFSWPRA